MNVIAWIVFGAVLGILSRLLDTNEARGGLIGSILFGIIGSVTGGFLATTLFGGPLGHIDISTFVIVVSVAVFLLMVQRTVFSRQERF